VSLVDVLLISAGVAVAGLAALGAWYGYRFRGHSRRLAAQLSELEQRVDHRSTGGALAQPAAVTNASPPLLVIISSHLDLCAECIKVVASLDHFSDGERTPVEIRNRATFRYWSDSGWNGSHNGWK
jgi:hypothetical protein